jgi:hypothetical protein
VLQVTPVKFSSGIGPIGMVIVDSVGLKLDGP